MPRGRPRPQPRLRLLVAHNAIGERKRLGTSLNLGGHPWDLSSPGSLAEWISSTAAEDALRPGVASSKWRNGSPPDRVRPTLPRSKRLPADCAPPPCLVTLVAFPVKIQVTRLRDGALGAHLSLDERPGLGGIDSAGHVVCPPTHPS